MLLHRQIRTARRSAARRAWQEGRDRGERKDSRHKQKGKQASFLFIVVISAGRNFEPITVINTTAEQGRNRFRILYRSALIRGKLRGMLESQLQCLTRNHYIIARSNLARTSSPTSLLVFRNRFLRRRIFRFGPVLLAILTRE